MNRDGFIIEWMSEYVTEVWEREWWWEYKRGSIILPESGSEETRYARAIKQPLSASLSGKLQLWQSIIGAGNTTFGDGRTILLRNTASDEGAKCHLPDA